MPPTAKKAVAKKIRLRDLIAVHGWPRIGDDEWALVCAALPGVTPEDLAVAGVPVDAPWCGVRQHTLDELETSLISMSEVYGARADLRRVCRAIVIRAKDRARGASRNVHADAARRALKAEMVEWMLIWLGDPSLFPAWVQIRRERVTRSG